MTNLIYFDRTDFLIRARGTFTELGAFLSERNFNISTLSGALRFSFYKPSQIFDKHTSMLVFFFVIRQTSTFLQCQLQCMHIKCVLRLISL